MASVLYDRSSTKNIPRKPLNHMPVRVSRQSIVGTGAERLPQIVEGGSALAVNRASSGECWLMSENACWVFATVPKANVEREGSVAIVAGGFATVIQ
jgi:hypothetical protein